MDLKVEIPLIVVSLFWLLVGAVLPCVIPKGPNRGIIQTSLVLTAVCCYLFWLAVYLFQMYPLIGPVVDSKTVRAMQWSWANATSAE